MASCQRPLLSQVRTAATARDGRSRSWRGEHAFPPMVSARPAIATEEVRLVLVCPLSMPMLKDTWIVFGAELRRALKSPRVLLVLFLYAAFSAGITAGSSLLARAVQKQLEAQGNVGAENSPKAALVAFLFGDDRVLVESLFSLPAMVLDCSAEIFEFAPGRRTRFPVFDIGAAERAVDVRQHLGTKIAEQSREALRRFPGPGMLRRNIAPV